MYLLDASAIVLGLRLHGSTAFRSFVGHKVLDLTKFELGNTAWKEYAVLKKGTEATATQDLLDYRMILGFMEEHAVTDEELPGVMEKALRHRLTFYDASYLYTAESEKLVLVTEDAELRRAASAAGVETLRVDEIIAA